MVLTSWIFLRSALGINIVAVVDRLDVEEGCVVRLAKDLSPKGHGRSRKVELCVGKNPGASEVGREHHSFQIPGPLGA